MKKESHHAGHKVYGSKKPLIIAAIAVAALLGAGIFELTDRDGLFGSKKAKILFVGDMMFDRTMRKWGEAKGYDYLFSCIDGYLDDSDLVVGNLEGPVTLSPSLSLGTKPGDANNTTFTFAPTVVKTLARNNIRAVSLGNNHIWDFGREGAESTMESLAEEDILHFGSPNGDPIATTTVNGIRVAFVSFNQFLGENRPERTVSAIGEARKSSDFVFVYSHWGEEYEPVTEYQKALAHRFIDAGADMVIGSHPHIIQEHEIYGGRHIFYSLGNFIFDQYWTEGVRTGGAVEVSLRGKKVSVVERRFDLSRDGRVCLR